MAGGFKNSWLCPKGAFFAVPAQAQKQG